MSQAVAIICNSSHFHPYECGGTEEGCIQRIGDVNEHHDPDVCALCHHNDDEETQHLRSRLADALNQIAEMKSRP